MSETTEIDFDSIKHETPNATLFEADGKEFWIPKSVIGTVDESAGTVEVPVWFAEKEGLV